MRISFALWTVFALLAGSPLSASPAQRVLIEQGKSAYTIYHDPQAPASVQRAAKELSRVLAASTGVALPMKTAPVSPMICLGVNDSSRAAGLDKDLPEVGFRVVTKGDDVFILGKDGAGGPQARLEVERQGTLLGAYDFLERIVDVRWLMPGDLGEDLPRHEKISVPDLDLRESAAIGTRWLIGVKDARAEVRLWKTRSKMDIQQGGVGVNWSHSFHRLPDEQRRAHPEFMALKKDGTRTPVPAAAAPHVMYCLSNPKFFDTFAEFLIEQFEKNPRLATLSMSPDEGAAWCQCPDCLKLTMPIAPQWKDLGVVNTPQRTPAVLNFYNEVARRVRARCPDRILGGMIYQDYVLPLEKPIPMEPNIVLGIAINAGYGFKFYQPRRAQILQEYFDEWAKYGVPLGYYDYSTWMRNWFGVPLPPGRSLLKWLFPLIHKNKVDVLQYIGTEAWGYGAVQNYLVAKLMWNPAADVDALYNDFLRRAYGAPAAPLIDRIYTIIDDHLRAYILSRPYPDHEIDYAAAKAIYGPIYPEIERLYLEALGKTTTEAQRRRLELLGENLVMANFNLRKAHLLPEDEAQKSPLYRSDDAFKAFIQEKQGGLGIIQAAEWIKTYGYPELPVLKEGWKPR